MALTTIAETLTLAGAMEGKHTIDTAVLANPVITEFIKGLGDVQVLNILWMLRKVI